MGKTTKIALLLAAGTAGAAAVYVGMHSGARSGDVLESAPRISRALSPAPPPAAMPPAPAPETVPYLTSLPEPEDEPALRVGAAKHRAPPSAPRAAEAGASSPLPEVPSPAAQGKAAEAKACPLGSRALDGCNCFDEKEAKVTLRQTKSCIDEEALRLGHRVLVRGEDGHYELAGEAPRTYSSPVFHQGRGLATIIRIPPPAPPAVAHLQPPSVLGVCPAGTKNEGCRCALIQVTMENYHGQMLPHGEHVGQYVPAADPPAYCSNPDMRAVMNAPVPEYLKTWLPYIRGR